jgi:hypothetical protein
MTTNLRICLSILTLGFAIEGGGELYSFVSRGAYHPSVSLFFILLSGVTIAGLLFLWIGRHEWNALHRSRVRRAHLTFGLSLLGGAVGGATVAVLYEVPSLGVPLGAEVLFGASMASLILGTFVTYVILVFHLAPRMSQLALLASIAWALLISVFIGAALAANLPTVMTLLTTRTFSVPRFVGPVDTLASYLFVSYFLLLAAYLDTHRTVLRGPPDESSATVPLPTP